MVSIDGASGVIQISGHQEQSRGDKRELRRGLRRLGLRCLLLWARWIVGEGQVALGTGLTQDSAAKW
jgi:hypothetical protein